MVHCSNSIPHCTNAALLSRQTSRVLVFKLIEKADIQLLENVFSKAISETFRIINTVIQDEMNVENSVSNYVRYMLRGCEKESLSSLLVGFYSLKFGIW